MLFKMLACAALVASPLADARALHGHSSSAMSASELLARYMGPVFRRGYQPGVDDNADTSHGYLFTPGGSNPSPSPKPEPEPKPEVEQQAAVEESPEPSPSPPPSPSPSPPPPSPKPSPKPSPPPPPPPSPSPSPPPKKEKPEVSSGDYRSADSSSSGGGMDMGGDLTFYGGNGANGACTSDYVPKGFTTVAMNNPQYGEGEMCGQCVHACYNDGSEKCFDAIVDNLCPECSYGDLDLGENGDGRWPVKWKKIPCPTSGPLEVSTQGSNGSYAKVKFAGGSGPVKSATCGGKKGEPTPDGYFIFNGGSADEFCGGMDCEVEYDNGMESASMPGTC